MSIPKPGIDRSIRVPHGIDKLWTFIRHDYNESQGFQQTTWAMETLNGTTVRIVCRQEDINKSFSISDSMVFIPGLSIRKDKETGKHYLFG